MEVLLSTQAQGVFLASIKRSFKHKQYSKKENMHLDSYYNCMLYQLSVEETMDHLFLDCQFAKECFEWYYNSGRYKHIGGNCSDQGPTPSFLLYVGLQF